jgi:hypothetical protein
MKVQLKVKGRSVGKCPLAKGDYSVGTGENQMIFLYGPGQEDKEPLDGHYVSVSPRHLAIRISDESLTLKDEGSENGSFLNEKRFWEEQIREPGNYRIRLGGNFSMEFIVTN